MPRCPYGEGMGANAQCTYEEGHYGPHSYELEEDSRRTVVEIQTDTKVRIPMAGITLQPVGDTIMLQIDRGGERGEPLQKAMTFVTVETLEQAIEIYKEKNNA